MQTMPSIKNAAPSAKRGLRKTPQRTGLAAGVGLIVVIGVTLWCAGLTLAGDEPIGAAEEIELRIPALSRPVKQEKKKTNWNAAELRKKYRFESLADRLAYEGGRQVVKVEPVANAGSRLNEAAQKSLDAQEASIESQRRFDLRTRALAELHSSRVEQFISREGFGVGRLLAPTPTPSHLELPEAPPLQFASVSSEAIHKEGTRSLPIPATIKERGETLDRLPSVSMLRGLHTASRWNFFNLPAWGIVNDKQQVAGFEGHAFRYLPTLVEPRIGKDDQRPAEPDPKHPWHVTRLELVSLLKHDKPMVYVSDHLPKMAELARAPVRDLNEFERRALPTLRNGDELAADATLNRIRMLGAVRASKQCLECHGVKRGDLLGGFSYELRRDPPVKPVRKPAA